MSASVRTKMLVLLVLLACCSLTSLLKPAFAAVDQSMYRFHSMPETFYYGGIHSIAKDSIGRVWFSGADAVYKYNGDTFEMVTEKITFLSPNSLWSFGQIACDEDGNLFIATNQGLVNFDYKNELYSFVCRGNIGTMRMADGCKLWIIHDNRIESLDVRNSYATREYGIPPECDVPSLGLFCQGPNVYASTGGNLYRINPATGEYSLAARIEGSEVIIKDILEKDDNLYVLTLMGGIYVFDFSGRFIQRFSLPDGSEPTGAKELFLDEKGIVWAASQSGLLLIDSAEGKTCLLRTDLLDPYSLPNNSVWTIYQDPDGGIWIGTYGGKLAYMNFNDGNVIYVKATPGGLNHRIVSCFEEDSDGNLWIGTEGGGINLWDRHVNVFKYFTQENGSGIISNSIKRIHIDSAGEISFSAFNGGVEKMDGSGRHLRSMGLFSQASGKPLTVYDFEPEGNEGLWLTNPDDHLMYKNFRTRRLERPEMLDGNGNPVGMLVETAFHDAKGRLWLVSHSGVYTVDPHSRKILSHHRIEGDANLANQLCCYCQTSFGDIYFGSKGGGVTVLGNNGEYYPLRDKNGLDLMGKMVFGLVEDLESKDIWISTNDGLYCYSTVEDILSKSGINVTNNCGAFYIRSCFRTSKGELLFGGTDGFIMFSPSRLKPDPQKPKVYFTDLKIDNIPVRAGEDGSPLSRSISTMSGSDEIIKLNHDQANFEIDFSSDNFFRSDQNAYSYRMIGISNEWQRLPHGQKAIRFFNIHPGRYRFEIRAANSDGKWSDSVSSLHFKVMPPFYQSALAYFLYLVATIAVIAFVWRYFANKQRFEQKLELEKVKEQNMKDLMQARMGFFTNISHDLKTPLSLVIDPLKQLTEILKSYPQAQKNVEMIERNVQRIKHMINQLLQFRKIESNKLVLNRQPDDLIGFLDSLYSLFEPYANRHGIDLEFYSEYDKFLSSFDHEVIETIFTNLLSNAIKYTTDHGYVGIRISHAAGVKEQDYANQEPIMITVTNSATEIPDGLRKHIFESFSTFSNKPSEFDTSSGLGLSIVNELVKRIGGSVDVDVADSRVAFMVMLPFEKGLRSGENINVRTAMNGISYGYTIDEIEDMLSSADDSEMSVKRPRKHLDIVLIEDDDDLRHYITDRLSEYYNIYAASNGNDGIAMAEKVCPSIVITDLMMPGTDGFTVCRSLRSDIKTSHIPIIALSGLGDTDNNKVKALDSGANVFIDKPFDLKFLVKQIDNLVNARKELKELYSKRYIAEPSKVTISSIDENILRRAMECIEKNIDNENYNVEAFASDMAIGRTQLYQKINDITGMSIKEFIMDIRLKRAAQLLKESDLTIAEISVRTGFANPKYFSICFKRHFDVSPTEFKKNIDTD